MSEEGRRHLAAIVALVVGSFIGLTLLPLDLTGPIGQWLGATLWRALGVGAVGFPLLGFGLALAGFDRLPHLDMKRVAILVGGLALLVPFLIGVVTDVRPIAYDSGALAPRLTGVLPGFFSYHIVHEIGLAGGLLLGFALLSALTIATLAWHPLRRLVRVVPAAADAPVVRAVRCGSHPGEEPLRAGARARRRTAACSAAKTGEETEGSDGRGRPDRRPGR